MPRHDRSGWRHRRTEARTEPGAVGSHQGEVAYGLRPHARLHAGRAHGRGNRRHRRLFAKHSERHTGAEHSVTHSLANVPKGETVKNTVGEHSRPRSIRQTVHRLLRSAAARSGLATAVIAVAVAGFYGAQPACAAD